jgi:DNA-binding NtrC family response regulator
MVEDAEILVVDYENSIPRSFRHLVTNGYRTRTVNSNADASTLAMGSDLIVLIVADKKRECLKLMEHIRTLVDQSVNIIVILSGSDDRVFIDRIDSLTFQCFKKDHLNAKDLTKAIHNAIEMRMLKLRERRFVEDLDRIEDELKKVEHRLYTISSLKNLGRNDVTFLN